MGSRANVAYERLRKHLLGWPGVRERPEKPGSPLGEASVKPTLRLGGGRLVLFHRDAARCLHAALRIPEGVADEVPEAERTPQGELWASFDLSEKDAGDRVEALARRLYQVHTGRWPPPS